HLSVNVLSDLARETDKWKEHWLRELLRLKLDIRVELGAARRSLRQIHQLAEGTEILLDRDAVLPLDIYVEGLPKLQGMMGACRGSRAVRLVGGPKPRP